MVQGMVSLYLAEISPQKIRGTIGSCHQLAVTIGILLSQILGLREALGKSIQSDLLKLLIILCYIIIIIFLISIVSGTADGWPILLGLTGVPALISCVILPFCPESPRFLLINRKDEKGAVAGRLIVSNEVV